MRQTGALPPLARKFLAHPNVLRGHGLFQIVQLRDSNFVTCFGGCIKQRVGEYLIFFAPLLALRVAGAKSNQGLCAKGSETRLKAGRTSDSANDGSAENWTATGVCKKLATRARQNRPVRHFVWWRTYTTMASP